MFCTQYSFGCKIKLFWPNNFLDQHFLTQTFLVQRFFWTQFFWVQTFDLISFWTKIFDSSKFLYAKTFWGGGIFIQKSFVRETIFSFVPKFLYKFFYLNFFLIQIFFDPKYFLILNIYFTLKWFGPQFFLELTLFCTAPTFLILFFATYFSKLQPKYNTNHTQKDPPGGDRLHQYRVIPPSPTKTLKELHLLEPPGLVTSQVSLLHNTKLWPTGWMIFNERKLVLGLALVMLCYVSETKKVSKQFDLA